MSRNITQVYVIIQIVSPVTFIHKSFTDVTIMKGNNNVFLFGI
jgi:hypothetical protein